MRTALELFLCDAPGCKTTVTYPRFTQFTGWFYAYFMPGIDTLDADRKDACSEACKARVEAEQFEKHNRTRDGAWFPVTEAR